MKLGRWFNKTKAVSLITILIILLGVAVLLNCSPAFFGKNPLLNQWSKDDDESHDNANETVALNENDSITDELIMAELKKLIGNEETIPEANMTETTIKPNSMPRQEVRPEQEPEKKSWHLSQKQAERMIKDINNNYLLEVDETNREIDRRIAEVEREAEEEIVYTKKYYAEKSREFASKMRKRGLYESGICEGGMKKIENERDCRIEEIISERDEEIRQLENLRESCLAELEQWKDESIQNVLVMCE